jgi:hypothetical protein
MGMNATRNRKWAGLVLAVGLAPVMACGLEVGDLRERVEEELGDPLAYVRVNDFEVFQFERGRVEARAGVVSSVNLMTQEEAEEAARQQAEAEAERAQQEREWRAQREREGLQVLQERLSDPDFLSAPAATRVAAWQEFRRSFPEVGLPDDYYAALRERQAELVEIQESERIAAMERRVSAAEARAAAAEQELIAEQSVYRAYPPWGYYDTHTYPSITYGGSSRYRVRAPTVTFRPYPSTPGYGFQRPLPGTDRPDRPRGGDGVRSEQPPEPGERRGIGNITRGMTSSVRATAPGPGRVNQRERPSPSERVP